MHPEMHHVFVRALPEAGFHRAGRFWPGGENAWTEADVSAEDLAKLEAEPRLVVRHAAPDAPSAIEGLQQLLGRADAERAALAAKVAELAPLADGAADAMRSLHAKIADLEAKLVASDKLVTEEARAHDGTREKLAKTEKALASAQEACSKLREELKALRSKKGDKPEEPSPAPATPAQG